MTYHLKSAEDINIDLLNAIKTAFKERPIVLTIEEETDETAFLLSNKETKAMILKSISEDKNGQYINVPVPEIK